jgi:TPR repeat protein
MRQGRTMRRLLVMLGVALFCWAEKVQAQTPVTQCDRLAGLASLPRLADAPGVHAIGDRDAALRACEAAVTSYPGESWFRVLLARVLVTVNPRDPRPVRLLTEAAEAIPALAHAQLARLYESGQAGVPADERAAREFYDRACDHWPDRLAAPGCAGLGVMMVEGRGGPLDARAGFNHLDFACRQGWGAACVDLALQGELRGDDDPGRVASLFEAGCAAGDLLGCSLLGFRHELGEGVTLDMARAQELYRRACEGGEPQGCSNLGEVYRSGLGVRPDIDEAVRLFRIGCDGQDPYACVALGFILAEGRGVAPDPEGARAAFETACALGDPEGCDMIDVMR